MSRVLDTDVGFLQLAVAFDVNIVKAVHQNVADARIFEERFERSQSENFVQHFFNQALSLRHGHRNRFFSDQALHNIADLLPDPVFVEGFELIGRKRIQQLGMNLRFDGEPSVCAGARTRYGAGIGHADFASAILAPVALSTNARKIRSRSPAAYRSAMKGRPRVMAATTAGESGIP